jgi:hypothetical protein
VLRALVRGDIRNINFEMFIHRGIKCDDCHCLSALLRGRRPPGTPTRVRKNNYKTILEILHKSLISFLKN